MNATQCKEFKACKVISALQQMAPLKEPGPDGMLPLFYQHFWSTVNHDFTSSILSWLNLSTIPFPPNHIFITLVPKINSLEYAHQFTPLTFVMYFTKYTPKSLQIA